MDELNKFNKYVHSLFKHLPFAGVCDFKEKDGAVFMHTSYMLNRTQSMFKYSGLPDTIPQRMLELYLQVNGNCCITEVDGSLYAFTGGLGGEPDEYYRPTIYTVANPALKFSANLKINDECIVIPNDSLLLGLMPLFNRYASLMTETELSIYIALINSRLIDLISASDDATKASAEKMIENVEKGNLGVIAETAFLEGLKALPYGSQGNSNQFTQLIETEQYLKAGWFNDIGLNANYNMKREALSTAESQLNDDALLPLVDDLLRCRKNAIEKVNEKYGTNITVDLFSSWQDNKLELEAEQEEIEQPEQSEPELEQEEIENEEI